MLLSKRCYSTFHKTVPLSFTKYDITAKNTTIQRKNPLIICHGLFGSKQNWKSLAKSISSKCNCQVYTIDARNHGESPHIEDHSYEHMGNDLIQFIKDENLQHPMLMGHSMGGKVIMNVALRTNIPSKMIVVDMAPVPLKLSREYSMHIEAMRDIQSRRLTKQKEADDILKQYEPDLVVRQFLLTNLKKNRSDGVYQFRIPFDILDRALGRMGQFDKLSPQQPYIGPTLFITGGKSPFRKQFIDHPDEIKAQFPNAIIENIPEAGHWVQAEKPNEFLDIATRFINRP